MDHRPLRLTRHPPTGAASGPPRPAWPRSPFPWSRRRLPCNSSAPDEGNSSYVNQTAGDSAKGRGGLRTGTSGPQAPAPLFGYGTQA